MNRENIRSHLPPTRSVNARTDEAKYNSLNVIAVSSPKKDLSNECIGVSHERLFMHWDAADGGAMELLTMNSPCNSTRTPTR